MQRSLAILNLVVVLGGIGATTLGRAQKSNIAPLPTPVIHTEQECQEKAKAAYAAVPK
jgi:hypothetical protein